MIKIHRVSEGLEIKPVGKEHAKKISEAWLVKFANSEKFISDLLEFNPSMGIYDKTGELLAWSIR